MEERLSKSGGVERMGREKEWGREMEESEGRSERKWSGEDIGK